MAKAEETIGQRIRRFREDRGLSASQLAGKADLSKSYISELESANGGRPSADTLYKIATALGVAISDLLGRPITVQPKKRRPPSLIKFAKDHNLAEADIEMLAGIEFRGHQPQSPDRWAFIYQAIRNSVGMDPRPK